MTAADPFTKASPHFVNAQRGAGRTGSAFESHRGQLFNLGNIIGGLHAVVCLFRGGRML